MKRDEPWRRILRPSPRTHVPRTRIPLIRPVAWSLVAFSLFGAELAQASRIPPSKSVAFQQGDELRIRVRLVEAVPKADVRGFDLVISSASEVRPAGSSRRPDALSRLSVAAAADRMSRWEFRCNDGRIRATPITEAGPGETLNLQEPVAVRTPAGFFSFGGKPYRDELFLYSQGSFCEVVNEVGIEKYLDGLVNAEFSSRWNEEAIEAQVVAARTYAYHQMKLARAIPGRHFDVDATIRDQVYDGSIREDFRASRAVQNTRGLLLTVGSSRTPEPIKAFYHSTCGGRTELPENVWGNPFPGFKRGVTCRFCSPSPSFSWNAPMSARELAALFLRGARADGPPPGWPRGWQGTLAKAQLLDLRVSKITPQGRVLGLVTRWTDGPSVVELHVSGGRFRDWAGVNRLKSAIFQVTSAQLAPGASGKQRIWVFHGRGFGHGVGMCQWGAKVMGEKGYGMAAILRHYYPDAILRRLW